MCKQAPSGFVSKLKKVLFLIAFLGVLALPQIFISQETLDMTKTDIATTVENVKSDIVEHALIYAIIKQESVYGQFCIRYEPGLKKQAWYVNSLKPEERNYPYAYCSAGVMQVLLGVARSRGYQGSFYELMRNDTNISTGVSLLESLFRTYGNIKDVIAAYNGGGWAVSHKLNGVYPNQEYVNNVYAEYKNLGGKL